MNSVFQALQHIHLKTVVSIGLAGAVLAGCGGASNVAETVISGGREPIQVSPDTFAPPVPCPPMELKSNTFLIRKYERGKDNQRDALLYQATIEDWANSCTREGTDQRRIKLGFSGDVTPGPAWKGGEVVLPLRVAVITSSDPSVKPTVSEILPVPVTLSDGGPAEKWTLIEEKFVIDQSRSAKIVFGFDEGRR